ncbi:MAG: hypothetical protein WC730_00730 [Patescibacteria group bacterium]|jgi:hypothetical protein
MWKYLSSLFILLVAIGAVLFLWNLQRRYEDSATHDAGGLIEGLMLAGNMESTLIARDFIWHIGRDREIEVAGVEIEVARVAPEQVEAAEAFLVSHGFALDGYNTFVSDLSSIRAYRNENTVCLLGLIPTFDEEGNPTTETGTFAAQCGTGDEDFSIETEYDDGLLGSLGFALGFDATNASVDVLYQDEQHIRGEIEYSDASNQRTVDAFLAHYNGSSWIIFWNGSGEYSCDDAKELEYLKEMMTDCTEVSIK